MLATLKRHLVDPFTAEGQKTGGQPRDPKWYKLSRAWLAVHQYCEYCGEPATVVHHVLPFHLYPEFELCEWNWQAADERKTFNCHLWLGHGGNFKLFNPNARADAAVISKIIRALKTSRRSVRDNSLIPGGILKSLPQAKAVNTLP